MFSTKNKFFIKQILILLKKFDTFPKKIKIRFKIAYN